MCLDKKENLHRVTDGKWDTKISTCFKKAFTFGLSVIFLISNNPMKICGVKIDGSILK